MYLIPGQRYQLAREYSTRGIIRKGYEDVGIEFEQFRKSGLDINLNLTS